MRVAIFGAGQAGFMVSTWLPADQKLICYIDNNESKQGTMLDGTDIVSLEDALKRDPELIWLSVLNKEAAVMIRQQIENSGFAGIIRDIQEIRVSQDIRLSAIRLAAREIRERNIPGEMAELGVYQGVLAAQMNLELPDKELYLFDTFEGFEASDVMAEQKIGRSRAKTGDFSDTSVEFVMEKMAAPEKVHVCRGHFPESLTEQEVQLPELALVSLDPDLYEPVYQGLKRFYPRLVKGGMIVIHDYNSMQFPGAKMAVRKFCEEENLFVVPLMDLHGTAILIKN